MLERLKYSHLRLGASEVEAKSYRKPMIFHEFHITSWPVSGKD